jgi:CheY-like chemotaxis protein
MDDDLLVQSSGTSASSKIYMSKILLVEDSEERCTWFRYCFIGCQLDITCDVQKAIDLMKKNTYKYIFLDHDLKIEHYTSFEIRDDENTGYGVAKWIADNSAQREAEIIIHSLNPSGSDRMLAALKSSGHNVKKIGFLALKNRMSYHA